MLINHLILFLYGTFTITNCRTTWSRSCMRNRGSYMYTFVPWRHINEVFPSSYVFSLKRNSPPPNKKNWCLPRIVFDNEK